MGNVIRKKRKKKLSNNIITTVSFDISVNMLDNIMIYIFIDPDSTPYITRRSLTNIKEFIKILDKREYEMDIQYMSRFSFIQNVLELQLKENIFNYDMIISRILEEGFYKSEIEEFILPFLDNEENQSLPMEEIQFINKFIEDRLKYSYLFIHKSRINELFRELSTTNYASLSDINNEIEKEIVELSNDLRRAKLDDESNTKIDFSNSEFKSSLLNAVKELKKPTKFLKSGIINLNKIFNGGFESGRLYLFMGVSGGFKSGILLNILYWIKKYNTKFESKNPDKIPTVLYITQENSINETIERLWNIGCSDDDIRKNSDSNILNMFENGIFSNNDENNINVAIEYRGNKTISTDDLYDIYDDYMDNGREIVCVIHDYTKRIRPSQPTNDLRIDLGNIVDEEKLFCQTKNIPFITAAQLNRKAMETIEETLSKGKNNAIDKLGASNVGESWSMIENSDYVVIINKEYIQSNNSNESVKEYLSFKQIKARGKKNINYNLFYQPFKEGNGMKLIDDVENGKSLSYKSIEKINSEVLGDVSAFNSQPIKKKKNTINRRNNNSIVNLDKKRKNIEEDLMSELE